MTSQGMFFIHVMKTGGKGLGGLLSEVFATSSTYPNVSLGERAGAKMNPTHLLETLALEGGPRDFYSVHMPAWVAFDAAPGHLKATVLREPVGRTVSHLRHIARFIGSDAPLDSLYEEDRWRIRLANYQTRMFSQARDDFLEGADLRAALRDIALSDREGAASEREVDMKPFFGTAVGSVGALGDDALGNAIRSLEAFDEVGVTAQLDEFVGRLAKRLGATLRAPAIENAATNPSVVSPQLLEMIRADSALDVDLYDRACELASRPLRR